VLLLGALVTGCTDDAGGSGGSAGRVDDGRWRTSTAPVDASGLSWAVGSTVHLADGTTVDTGRPPRGYVVAGDGVFFVPADDDTSAGDSAFTGADLWFVRPGADPGPTGLEVAGTGLARTPDGSRLVVLDADYDEGTAVMRFLDLSSGEETTSEDGMDTSGIDDRVDHLLEAEVEILAVDDERARARVIEGEEVYDLRTGEGVPASDDEPPLVRDALTSPDGTWRIEKPDSGPDRVVDADGRAVDLQVPQERWNLSWWADADTVVGTVITGPGTGKKTTEGDTVTLLSCAVATGECTVHEGSAGETVLFPLRSSVAAIMLRDGE
jgi:hypothetical protein